MPWRRLLFAVVMPLLVVPTVSAPVLAHASAPVESGTRQDTAPEETAVVVTGITDGDIVTVRLPDGREETLRLLGIDAPEQGADGRDDGCFASEAAARTRDLAAGQMATLEFDTRQRDRTGRLLGYLRIDGHRDSLNEQLVAEGMALPLTVGPNAAYNEDLRAAARRAQLATRGIWAACNVSDPPTVATDYPLAERPPLTADEPIVRLAVGTERDDDGRQLTVLVEARADNGLRGILVSADRPDDPIFSTPREIPCDGQTVCRATWTARPRGLGTYTLSARAVAVDDQVADASVGMRVVGRWQTIAAQAVELRARAAAQSVPRAEDVTAPATDGSCPASHPVKGLQADAGGDRRYLLPDDIGYDVAPTAICYASEDAASSAGFRHVTP